jgi:transcription initiation factor TFIIIB Brf1 subunit/transcription initiation factor TFIIB
LECPTCKGIVVSPEGQNGEKVCSRCGLVLTKTSSKTPGFTQWNPQWHSNWGENDSETLKEWLTILRTVSCQLNLPTFPYREEAARRIRKESHMLFQSQRFGKHKRATVAALLHQILRQYEKNRSIKDMCQQLGLDSRLVTKQVWNLNKTIIENRKPLNVPRKIPRDYLFEFGGKLTTDIKILTDAERILTKVKRIGGNPIALASGAFYLVCRSQKLQVSKEQIGKAFKISHRTVYTNEARIRTLLHHKYIQKPETTSRNPRIQLAQLPRSR